MYRPFVYVLALLALVFYGNSTDCPDKKSFYPEIKNVKLKGGILGERVNTVNEITIPYCLDKCIETGIVENFSRAAGLTQGDYIGLANADEFLYKAIEAASYALVSNDCPALDRRLDSIISIIAAAQEPDGYLRTPQTIYWLRNGAIIRKARWTNLNGDLELYCAGHLIEAAVAHCIATGKQTLLNVAKRKADLICGLFGKGKTIQGVDMIPEIELALIRLYELTDEKKYLDQAAYFIEERGDSADRKLMGPFSLDHQLLKDQKEAVGHATFAAYLYSAAVDLVNLHADTGYRQAIQVLWNNMVSTKMSINGGIGAQHENEGFGAAYDLPDLTAYNEICAAVAFCNLNKRMFQMDRQAKYFDVLEHTLYNNLLSGVSVDGKSFFYVCPTESKPDYKFNLGWCPDDYAGPYQEPKATRKSWLPCACCPPTLARFLSSLPAMIYAMDGNRIYANLYASNEAEIQAKGQRIFVKQVTDYPWHGKVSFLFRSEQPFRGELLLRIPSWLAGSPIYSNLYRYADSKNGSYSVYVSGVKQKNIKLENGYARIDLKMTDSCAVDLFFGFEPRKIVADEKIIQTHNRFSIQYGPVLYCFEETDNPWEWDALADAKISEGIAVRFEPSFLLGCPVIDYSFYRNDQPTQLTAIPYFLWSNRGETHMKVWVP